MGKPKVLLYESLHHNGLDYLKERAEIIRASGHDEDVLCREAAEVSGIVNMSTLSELIRNSENSSSICKSVLPISRRLTLILQPSVVSLIKLTESLRSL